VLPWWEGADEAQSRCSFRVSTNLIRYDESPSPENSYTAVRAIYTRDDFNTARRSHKTFVETREER
jgi:hypothetical protein